MKAVACIVLLAAVALAAPEGKRDKRGYLHSDFGIGGVGFGTFYTGPFIEPAPIVSAPALVAAPAVVHVNKIVDVPQVVTVRKIVSEPKIVSHLSYAPTFSAGWW